MKTARLLPYFILLSFCGFSQSTTQTIRGQITDKESKASLPGANVILFYDSTFISGAVTDEEGNFRLNDVNVGRITLKFTYVGYNDVLMQNLILSAGKELILKIEMEESAAMLDEVKIVAGRKGEVINEMATVSAKQFSVEETERYAGSRGDPARMASNFAGVQGADDSRNDIVVRGNSPIGILWRMEGVDIPNPNHFAIAGTTGGPVSIINNKYLANSDFFTGAFPAEYGNSIAGVFDLNMRNGNNEKSEYSGQLGFLGTELFAEGPLNKEKHSSYLASFRYSTLQLFQFMQIPIGTEAVPNYFDGAFKFNFPGKKGNFSIYGIGGKSDIDILVSEYAPEDVELYGDSDRDQYFGTSMASTGISYGHQINSSTYGKATLAYSWQENHAHHELVYRDTLFEIDSIVPNMGYYFRDQKISAVYHLNKKINNKNSFKTGISLEEYFYNDLDSNLNLFTWEFDHRYDYTGTAYLMQAYFQWKYKVNENFVVNAGLHGQLFTMNQNSKAIEPRAGLKYNITERSSLSFGAGMHSQLLPSYQYTFQQLQPDGTYALINKDVGFIRSMHAVAGYDQTLAENLRMKIEIYYQYLYDVPVEIESSAFSLANEGSGFSRFFPDSLENTGTGKNYGIELTIEKFYSNHFYYLITGSLYDSRYTGSDGIERKTDFNGTFASNLLAGYELELKERNVLQFGTKITYAGGKLATPADIAATNAAKELVFIDSLTNTLQLKDYFRLDFKINYKINAKKKSITHEFALDLVNVLGIQNVLGLTYAPNPGDPEANPVKEEYQLGFLPLFYYKIDF